MEANQRLKAVLEERTKAIDPEIRRRLETADGLVVFGSFAAGVETESSDLDVFCVGEVRMHFKTRQIEILVLPEYDLYSEIWLGSELANHIKSYGTPLNSRPKWFDLATLSPAAADRKEKRIQAYLRSLEAHWHRLGATSKARFETKLRRELRRFQLLQCGIPVPPTKLLDIDSELASQPPSSKVSYLDGRMRSLFGGGPYRRARSLVGA